MLRSFSLPLFNLKTPRMDLLPELPDDADDDDAGLAHAGAAPVEPPGLPRDVVSALDPAGSATVGRNASDWRNFLHDAAPGHLDAANKAFADVRVS